MRNSTIIYAQGHHITVTIDSVRYVGAMARDHSTIHRIYLMLDVFELDKLIYENEKEIDVLKTKVAKPVRKTKNFKQSR